MAIWKTNKRLHECIIIVIIDWLRSRCVFWKNWACPAVLWQFCLFNCRFLTRTHVGRKPSCRWVIDELSCRTYLLTKGKTKTDFIRGRDGFVSLKAENKKLYVARTYWRFCDCANVLPATQKLLIAYDTNWAGFCLCLRCFASYCDHLWQSSPLSRPESAWSLCWQNCCFAILKCWQIQSWFWNAQNKSCFCWMNRTYEWEIKCWFGSGMTGCFVTILLAS